METAVTVGAVQRRRLLTWIVALVVAAVVLDGCGGADGVGRSSSRARPTPADPLRGVAADAAYLRSVLKLILAAARHAGG
jgi:predicted small secreted protein